MNQKNIKRSLKTDRKHKMNKNVIDYYIARVYNNIIIVQGVKNNMNLDPIEKAITYYDIERLEFTRTINFRPGKTIEIPYRIKQTGFNGLSTSCHLTSDLCYFKFHYEEPEKEVCKFCRIIKNEKCSKCEKDIIGLIPKDYGCDCHCDAEKGFNEEPNDDKKICPCKENYSFYTKKNNQSKIIVKCVMPMKIQL